MWGGGAKGRGRRRGRKRGGGRKRLKGECEEENKKIGRGKVGAEGERGRGGSHDVCECINVYSGTRAESGVWARMRMCALVLSCTERHLQ